MSIQIESTTITIDAKRGDVWLCDLEGAAASEQGGIRPCVVIQNSIGNKYSPCVIVATVTSKTSKKILPTHTILNAERHGFERDSIIQAEQLRTLDKGRLICRLVTIDQLTMKQIDKTLAISIGLFEEVFA